MLPTPKNIFERQYFSHNSPHKTSNAECSIIIRQIRVEIHETCNSIKQFPIYLFDHFPVPGCNQISQTKCVIKYIRSPTLSHSTSEGLGWPPIASASHRPPVDSGTSLQTSHPPFLSHLYPTSISSTKTSTCFN